MDDHIVGGEAVVPGAWMIEAMMIGGKSVNGEGGEGGCVVRDVVFHRLVPVDGMEVEIVGKSGVGGGEGNGTRVRGYTRSIEGEGSGGWSEFVSGIVVPSGVP